jgi:3-deoxy-D-manno-octulosonic-acid transferase
MLLFDLLYFIIILVSLPLWIKYLFKKQYRPLLKYRFSPAIEAGNKKRVWLHAVSVGEVRSLKNLVENLKEQYTEKEIVLSVTTPAGFDFARQQFPDIKVINAPLDFSFAVRTFIKKINPQLLILNELEIWPNWISIIHRKKIPVLLINGRISDGAFIWYKRFAFLLKPFFNKIHRFLVQTEIHKERFLQLGISGDRISVCGNIKADEAFSALEHLPPDHEILEFLGINNERLRERKIIVVASSHLSDEKLVIPIINKVAEKFFFIIVPRHLTRLEEIEKRLQDHQVSYSTWSKAARDRVNTQPQGNDDALIFDRMGYLFNVLKISNIVFMGGTLDAKIGGHNLYEPAVMGKVIVGGPCYNNFPAIGAELRRKGVYHVANNSRELTEFLAHLERIEFEKIKHEAVSAASARRGSSACILKEIQPFLN